MAQYYLTIPTSVTLPADGNKVALTTATELHRDDSAVPNVLSVANGAYNVFVMNDPTQETAAAEAPTILSLSPTDGATDVTVDANLVMTFSKQMARQGTVTLKNVGGATIQTFDLSTDGTWSTTSVTDDTWTGNPTADFANEAALAVQWSGLQANDGGVLANNATDTAWNFDVVAAAPSGLTVTYLGHDVVSSGTPATSFTFTGKTLGTGTIIAACGLARNAAFTLGSIQAGTSALVTTPMTDGVQSAVAEIGSQSTSVIYAIPCTDATGDIVVTLSIGDAWGCHITWWLVEGDYTVTDVNGNTDGVTAPWSLAANVNTVEGGAVFVAAQTRTTTLNLDSPTGFTSRGVSVINNSVGQGGDNLAPGTASPLSVSVGDADQSANNVSLVVVSIQAAA